MNAFFIDCRKRTGRLIVRPVRMALLAELHHVTTAKSVPVYLGP